MTWQSTLKAKAHEWVVWHYPLGRCQLAENNLASMQELVCGTKFVRASLVKESHTRLGAKTLGFPDIS